MPGAGASFPSFFYPSDPRLSMAVCRPPASFPLNRQRPDVTSHAFTAARSPVSYLAQEVASDSSLRRALGCLVVSHVPGSLCSRVDKTLPHLSRCSWVGLPCWAEPISWLLGPAIVCFGPPSLELWGVRLYSSYKV